MNRLPKFLFIAVLLVTGTLTTFSQSIRFGVFGDTQFSWFTSDTRRKFSSNGPVIGGNVGLVFEKFFSERYAFTSGISISNMGGNLRYLEPNFSLTTRDSTYQILENYSVKFKGQYITVPIGMKFKTNQIGYTTFYAELGAKAHVRVKGYVWQSDHEIDREVIDSDHQFFGFVSYMIGGGVEYSLGGPSAIQLGFLFTNGMTPAFDAGYGRISIGSAALRVGIVF